MTSQQQDDVVFERAKTHFVQSIGLMQSEKWAQAEVELRASLRLMPGRISSMANLSTVMLKLGQYTEAEALVHSILAMEPENPVALLNQGVLCNERKAFDQALKIYGRLLDLDPDYAEAWVNRGNALRGLGQYQEALAQYEHAVRLNSSISAGVRGLLECHKFFKDYKRLFEIVDRHRSFVDRDYSSNELLGYVYLGLGDQENAYDHFARARVISEKSPQENNRTEWPVLPSRIKHDYEQLTYLEQRGVNTPAGKKSLAILEGVINGAPPPPGATPDDMLLDAVSGFHHVPDIPFAGKALGDNDYKKIEATFLNSAVRLVVIDNFLSEAALANIRKFCNEATVWKRSYVDGYVGSFMGTGFCSRVILAIAEELRLAMPNVIGSNTLSHAWGFKYDQTMKGINLHADFANINTNFWITPDEACLDKNKGGLLIYDAPAPDDWGFYAYNADQKKIRAYLKEKNAQYVRVPYRENRCVLFDSTYFHATDDLYFEQGYTNRRINCTLLYGRAL